MQAFKNKGDRLRIKKDRIFYGFVIFFALLTVSPLILIVFKLVREGIGQINFDFFTQNQPNTFQAMVAIKNGETIPGGIANGIVGTLLMVVLASVMAIPVGVLTGVYLSENQNSRFASMVGSISDVLQGVPSIVLGVISYLWIVKHVTNGYSALAGSTSLAIMMLPLIVRSTEETLKMIPVSYKEAAFALGVPYHRVILKVLLPSSLSGLLTGILLSLSRILGETAPLMLTALGSSMINLDITQPTSAVPLLIWEFYNNPNMVSLIWSSSLFLMGLVLFFNIIAKRMAKKWKIQ
ncbi:MAG TPA: phosphate ABC transporter permease PstA [Bacteroidales bacterium]|nr:phosphate ABC transporter permease PstA [Bacteroidales bacterium]